MTFGITRNLEGWEGRLGDCTVKKLKRCCKDCGKSLKGTKEGWFCIVCGEIKAEANVFDIECDVPV